MNYGIEKNIYFLNSRKLIRDFLLEISKRVGIVGQSLKILRQNLEKNSACFCSFKY